MKKIFMFIISIITIGMVLVPSTVNAEEKVTNFEETINEEIATFQGQNGYEEYVDKLKKADLSNYKESDDKINVYIFRGNTCSYCLKAIVYFASIAPEYGKYFNLVTYEVWNNSDNANLFKETAAFLNGSADGVPYIIIGEKTFNGYSESMNAEIETQIKKEYESSNRYDVLKELKNNGGKEKSSNNNILGQFAITLEIVIAVGLIMYINFKNNKLREELENIKKNKKH